MKKFKGGLYADLSNYNTTLPNTEVLLNFFKSNPIGYRSGGMVRGIAGGNPTGMRVTGGFLANAQGYQPGGSVVGMSPYELGQYAEQQQRLPYLGTGEFAEKGAPLWSKERAKQELLDPEQLKLNISAYYQEPENLLSLLKKKGQIVDYSSQAKGVTKKGKEVPIWDKDARKYENDKWKKYSKEEKNAAKKSAVDDLLDQYYAEGEMYDVDPGTDTLPSDKKKEQDDTGIKSLDRGKKDPSEQSLGVSAFVPKSEEQKLQEELDKIKKPGQETSVTEGLSVDDLEVEETDKTKTTEKDTSTEKDNVAVGGRTKEMYDMEPEDWLKYFQSMSNKDEKQISSDDDELSKKIAKALNPDAKDKGKEAPGWAMPLMMAGLQMAASNNPDMLGALAEGGIKGLEEHARIQKEKREDDKYEQEMSLKKAGLIFDQERIKISKDQLKLTEQGQNYNIVSDAMNAYNNIQLEYDKMLNTNQWNEEEYKFKWGSLHQTAELKANDLAHDLLKFKATHELSIAKLSLDEQAEARKWYETEMGLILKKGLYSSQILANNAAAKAAGFKMGTVQKLQIGGKDIQVQVWRDSDGFHMEELGEAADTTQSRLLKDFMSTNPHWYAEYEADPEAFFEMLQAVKEMQSIFEDDEKADLSNVKKL